MPSHDPFRLQRFVDAQAPAWDEIVAELIDARKRTHWMWFVFPQLASLGRSQTAKFYGISGREEARAYLEHAVLGPRLSKCCELLMNAPQGVTAQEIFGDIDAMKLRSSLTLFAAVAPDRRVFQSCLGRYFGGERDPLTVAELGA